MSYNREAGMFGLKNEAATRLRLLLFVHEVVLAEAQVKALSKYTGPVK
ncbi:MAG: hypothetical protein ACOX7U_01905 [Desulfitobacteriia bacterium]|jgi:hypothetical protein